MHKLLTLLAIFTLLFSTSCSSNHPIHYPNKPPLLTHMGNSTVALVVDKGNGFDQPYCTGVFISKYTMLTAGHCVEAVAEHTAADGEAQTPLGMTVRYIVENEVAGQSSPPTAVHEAVAVKYDKAHDIALLMVKGSMPHHEFATIASDTPYIGEQVQFVGQTLGLYWSYTNGVVSNYRESLSEDDRTLRYLQTTSAGVNHGNSGGGCFNDAGELVGIVESMNGRDEAITFSIPIDVIQQFLNGDNKAKSDSKPKPKKK